MCDMPKEDLSLDLRLSHILLHFFDTFSVLLGRTKCANTIYHTELV
jgi:hypothetical protein